MDVVTVAVAASVALALSWVLTGLVRRFALAQSMLDIPNERSSHTVPTPRGGGIAIAAVFFAGCALAAWLVPGLQATCVALLGGGALVAGIGWLDDRRPVPARVRALVHLAAAVWAVGWLGGLPALRLGTHELALGPAGGVLAAVGIVWCINFYNFMDGIDGLAGSEAVFVSGVGAVLLWLAGDRALATLSACVGAAAAGFLRWNWSPARIFMGDVGSGLLGFVFGVLAVASEHRSDVPLLTWMLLLGVFVFDATVTLMRRMFHGERWYAAHRTHAYQRAVQSGLNHARVTGAILGINLVLGVAAYVGWRWPHAMPAAAAAGALVLAVAYGWVERVKSMYM